MCPNYFLHFLGHPYERVPGRGEGIGERRGPKKGEKKKRERDREERQSREKRENRAPLSSHLIEF
jgi:hypothetical protein